jgi:IclR family transcriptional regulator, KDG regulon repressor
MRTIGSVEKGMRILEIIAEMPHGARVKEISARMEAPSSNIALFLNALVKSGFVTKDSHVGRYFASHKFVEIAEKAQRTKYSQLVAAAQPHMRRLRDEFDENVLLAVLSGHDIQFIERLQSNRSVQILHNPDVSYPPHVTAGGKAIMAFLEPKAREKYLEDALYHRFTPKSLADPESLEKELETIRERGYAINLGEYEPEVMAIACPVHRANTVLGSIVVQFPTFRYDESELPGFGERILAVARSIEDSLDNQ